MDIEVDQSVDTEWSSRTSCADHKSHSERSGILFVSSASWVCWLRSSICCHRQHLQRTGRAVQMEFIWHHRSKDLCQGSKCNIGRLPRSMTVKGCWYSLSDQYFHQQFSGFRKINTKFGYGTWNVSGFQQNLPGLQCALQQCELWIQDTIFVAGTSFCHPHIIKLVMWTLGPAL